MLSTDTSLEDVHFRREWLSAEEIGWRAVAAALSDLAAMGAQPRWFLLSIALPAARGEDFLRELIGMDAGARRVGEFAFGLNDAVRDYTGSLLIDEKLGGSVHLALGRSVPGTGGENASALHWDMVCDLRKGGEVYADAELVYRDGRFLDGLD